MKTIDERSRPHRFLYLTMNLFSRFRRFYLSHDTLEEKLYWCIIPLSLLLGIASVIATVFERLGTVAVMSGIACIILSLLMIVLGRRNEKKLHHYYVVFCLLFNCIIMPFTFLSNGGIRSGMCMYCIASLMLCAFCSRKKDRMLIFAMCMIVYALLFWININIPEVAIPIRESFILYDILLNFIISGMGLGVITAATVDQVNAQRYSTVNQGIVDSLGSIIEYRSNETGQHVIRIKKFTEILLTNLNKVDPSAHYEHEEIRMIASAAVLHDIGKIAVPDNILNKPGRLTPEEFEEIKKHPLEGCEMIETMRDYQNKLYFDYCYEICRHHHENYDGSGYPDGLKGDEIPVVAQIVSLADVYDALTSDRVYKKAYTPDEAFEIMSSSIGKYSDTMIRCLRISRPELDKVMYESHAQEEAEKAEKNDTAGIPSGTRK